MKLSDRKNPSASDNSRMIRENSDAGIVSEGTCSSQADCHAWVAGLRLREMPMAKTPSKCRHRFRSMKKATNRGTVIRRPPPPSSPEASHRLVEHALSASQAFREMLAYAPRARQQQSRNRT